MTATACASSEPPAAPPRSIIFSGGKVIAEYDNGAAPSSPSREYIYSGSQLIATISGGATTYQHPDQLSVRVSTDSNGNVTRTFGHFPFGEAWYETGTASKWKFTSYERDTESNNDYALARSYSNPIARFTSPDLLGGSLANPQSLNRYAYVLGDPINLIDPLGLDCYPDGSGGFRCDVFAPYLPDFGGGGGGQMMHPPVQDTPDFPGAPYFGRGVIDHPPPPITLGPAPQPPPPCEVSPASLNAYLAHTPLAGQGQALFDAGARYNVDPRLIVSIAGAETGFGRNITRGANNAWNWLYNGRNSSFTSFAEGANTVTNRIANGPYYFQAGINNTNALYHRYCNFAVDPNCGNALTNLNRFMAEQHAHPNALGFPCN